MAKKAQFYLIASIILVLIIIGMASVTNYITTREEPTQFYNLGESLGIEGPIVVDFSIYNTPEDINSRIGDFVDRYSNAVSQTNDNFSLTVVYGNRDGATVRSCAPAASGRINTDIGEGAGYPATAEVNCEESALNPSQQGNGNNVNINIGNNQYDFDLQGNEEFMFVITSGSGSENFVYQNT